MQYDWIRMPMHIIESFEVQSLTDGSFRAWIEILLITNRCVPSGRLPPKEHLADLLEIELPDPEAAIDELIRAGLLVVDGVWLTPKDWHLYDPNIPYDEG